MEQPNVWEWRCQQAQQRCQDRIGELTELNKRLQDFPPELTEANNLKKRNQANVQKTLIEVESVSVSPETSESLILNQKNADLRKVWKQTEKYLIQVIRARDAESSIKDYIFDAVNEHRCKFDHIARKIGRDAIETERLREKNIEACASAEKLYKEWIYKAVDRARFLPLLEPMCSKLEREWNELIQGLNERNKILKEASSFWEGRDNFQWQCDAWIRHMQDLLDACHRRTGFETTTDYETLAINAEEFCTMCHQLHKSVASSGKKLLAFLQDTTDDDKRIKLDMSSSVEIICEALDELLSLRDRVRDCAETSRKIAAFYLDAEKVSKWINKLGRPFLDKSTSIGKSQERATKLLERHAEFERVCQNTYSNVEKLLSTGHSLTTQFEQYHSFIGNKCQTLKDLTDAFQNEVRARRELLEAAVSFYTKVKEIWKIFDELRVQRDGQGDVQQFERNRSEVKVAMKITVSEGAYLVARLKRSDPYAEQHILDIVHSIEKGQGQLNSQLASDQARLEAAKARVEWEKEVDEQCEKLQKWRLNYNKSANRETQRSGSDFGHLIQELNAFKIKEQGKCFDLGRAGRDLLMIRDENIDKTEEYLQKLNKEQRLFEQLVEETQNFLEHQGQMEEALNNAAWTLGWLKKAQHLFEGAPCKVDSLESAEFTQQEFKQYGSVMDRTEQVMQDFEMIQQTNKPDADEVITRRQEVNAVWSGLQLMVEDRKLLIKKAIKFYTTYDDVFQALDSLKKEYSDKSGEIYDPEISDQMELSQLQKAIEKHAAQRKLLNDATSMGHNYGNSFVKLIPEEARSTKDLVIGLLSNLRQADQEVHRAWSAKKKVLEQLHIFLMFQNSCRCALNEMQRNMQLNPAQVTANLPKLNRAIQKIFEISEINDTNAHKSKIKAWLHKIKQKHIDVHSYAGVKLENPPYNLESLELPNNQNNINGKASKNKKGDTKRQSLLQAELLKTEAECISILKLCLTIYLPAAKEKIAPPPIRENVDAIFGNIRELLAFHEDFYSQLQIALEVDDIAHCFVINADRLCQLYVEYCKGRERSTEIIANESEGYFAGVHQKKNAPQPLNSCLIWPVQRIPKYTMLLRELQQCSIGSAHSKSKLQEALKMVEDIPRKANDAIHLAMLQHSSVPRSELILQGQVVLKNEKILPMQKNRERHCFLFETAAIICKKAESTKEYIPKYSISTRKMTWELSDGTITINGSGNRAVFKPILKPDAEEWALRLKQVCSSVLTREPSEEASPKKANVSNVSTSSVPPPMNLFRSLPRPLKNKNSISDDFSLSKNSLEI
ncbi:Oidioi.mRNA.OKI2018_I69.XSR.g16010.t1.cds [Oikopleura dioica]|uniref:Oidioi.mRNA.OKI2018_I69.XSR.g16010.t1.cds n=1 Tax=Oikopleura dioica TaxID=34765 RepID=A0ABN7SEP5_OIKDI|nr:Oidioi.mRNA.OKI2018_I69.XSR.g16010.t1.cds [Oikopleura dioica]